MMVTDAMREAAPEPLYGCAARGCAEQKSVRAAELRWYRARLLLRAMHRRDGSRWRRPPCSRRDAGGVATGTAPP